MAQNGKVARFSNQILFLDVVAYSQRALEDQMGIVQHLSEVTKEIIAASQFKLGDDCLVLPTGDGFAICLKDKKPEDAAEIAKLIIERVHKSELKYSVRIGMHFDYDAMYEDINGMPNVVGRGINWAARVQSEALPNQILLSRTTAESLNSLKSYASEIVCIGDRTVKHDETERMFELVTLRPLENFYLNDEPVGEAHDFTLSDEARLELSYPLFVPLSLEMVLKIQDPGLAIDFGAFKIQLSFSVTISLDEKHKGKFNIRQRYVSVRLQNWNHLKVTSDSEVVRIFVNGSIFCEIRAINPEEVHVGNLFESYDIKFRGKSGSKVFIASCTVT